MIHGLTSHPRLAFVLLVALTFLQMVSLFTVFRDDRANEPECIDKSDLSAMFNRERRASISRPYFHHWRGARENGRHSAKNQLAFSPRLGKRAVEDDVDDESELIANLRHDDKQGHGINDERLIRWSRDVQRSADLEAFLLTFVDHLKRNRMDIVYEDASKICSARAIGDLLDEVHRHRREQDEDDTRGQYTKGKHPLLFRYRLG